MDETIRCRRFGVADVLHEHSGSTLNCSESRDYFPALCGKSMTRQVHPRFRELCCAESIRGLRLLLCSPVPFFYD